MGENALRKTDDTVIKIGRGDVCNLYYLRYEDRDKVEGIENSVDPDTIENIQWRLPLPDEDHLKRETMKAINPTYSMIKSSGFLIYTLIVNYILRLRTCLKTMLTVLGFSSFIRRVWAYW